MIVMGVHQQDLDTLFGMYRRAIEIAEATRQRAIAAALAEHCRALEDIEATYRRDVAEARRSYCQRIIEPALTSRWASVMVETQSGGALALPGLRS